jgi:hypothetical protein
MRDLQDYKDEDGNTTIGISSPFNIKDVSIRITPWTQELIEKLY